MGTTRYLVAATLLLGIGLVGCDQGDDAGAVSEAPEGHSLSNGAEYVLHSALDTANPVLPDLAIGSVDGEPETAFGDVRGIEVTDDGTILVLDYQAAEIRRFGPDGAFRGHLARRGGGPGEITEANGLARAPDGTLWVQDHSQWRLIRLDPTGDEIERIPMFVRQYGYLWNGAVDEAGRIWTTWSWPLDEAASSGPPEPGLHETTSAGALIAHDPSTATSDTIRLGTGTSRSWVVLIENGWGFRGIPFQPSRLHAVAPSGAIWTAMSDEYRIARLDSEGDTVLVIEVDRDPVPVTQADRQAYIEAAAEQGSDEERVARAIASEMPEHKPALAQLVVDDENRLWVRVAGEPGENGPRFDVFDASGAYLGSMRVAETISGYFVPRIRDGFLYTLAVDELDVQTVIRVPIRLDRPA